MISSGTPFDRLFADLMDRTGVPHTTGQGPSQRRRVEWSRSGPLALVRYPRGERHNDELSLGRFDHPWTATVYGTDDADVCALAGQVIAWLDILEGPPAGSPADGAPGDDDYVPERLGYDVKAGKVEPRGGDGTAAQWACDVSVTLRTKVASMIYTTKEATDVEVAVIATDTDGTDPQTGISFAVS